MYTIYLVGNLLFYKNYHDAIIWSFEAFTYLLAIAVFSQILDRRDIFISALTIALAHAIFIVLHMNGYVSLYDNIDTLTQAMVPFAVFCIAYLCTDKTNNKIYLSLSLAVLTSTIIFFAKNRASWLAFVICLGWMHRETILPYLNSKWKLLALTVCFIVAGYVLFSFKKNSSLGRILVYKVGFSLIGDHFLTGVGVSQLKLHYKHYQENYFRKYGTDSTDAFVADNTNVLFNEVLSLTAEQGLIGLLLLLICLTAMIARFKSPSQIAKHSILGLASFIPAILTSHPFQHVSTLLPILFLLIILFKEENHERLEIKKLARHLSALWYLLLLSCIATLFFYTTRWKIAYDIAETNSDIGLNRYAKIYNIMKINPYFLFTYGADLHYAGKFEKSTEILEQASLKLASNDLYNLLGDNYFSSKNFALARQLYIKSYYTVPYRFATMQKLMHTASALDKNDEVIFWAERIVKLPPKVNSAQLSDIKRDAETVLRKLNK